MTKPNPAATVIAIDQDDQDDEHDETHADAYRLGEPFALATGAELLDTEGRIPGCIVSARCDCGAAFTAPSPRSARARSGSTPG